MLNTKVTLKVTLTKMSDVNGGFYQISETIRKINDDIDALKAQIHKIMLPLITEEPLASNIDKHVPNIAKTIKKMEDAGSKILYCQTVLTCVTCGASLEYDVYYITPSGKLAYRTLHNVPHHCNP